MSYDYSSLFQSDDGISGTWRELYDDSLSLPSNLIDILKRSVFLPQDFYNIIAAYMMLPSALCKIVPYLALYGQSGSGKSNTAKIASYLHGVDIYSSSSTFAGIRNDLNRQRKAIVEVPSNSEYFDVLHKEVERNTCMVWEDIDPSVFVKHPDLYRMFKFGYDRTTDKIILSSGETGVNLEFHCFCPKIFSSITPFHLDDRFKELKRRLIVIPFRRLEELSDERKAELGILNDAWTDKIIEPSAYNWKGFSDLFSSFWDMDMAQAFLSTKPIVSKELKSLKSIQRTVSIDLLACGIVCGIWDDEVIAVQDIKDYWYWFDRETETNAGLSGLLKDYVKQETINARNGNTELKIYTNQLRSQITMWVHQGWLYEAPRAKDVKECMFDLGMKLQKGTWIKG